MKELIKSQLERVGLLNPARALRRQAKRGWHNAQTSLGFTPHRPMENRRYWENRGQVYAGQFLSDLTPEDPYTHAQQDFLRELRRLEWDSVLEVGCGFGWHLRAIREQYPHKRIAGIDFSCSQLRQGTDYLRGRRVFMGQADASRLPFADDAFDLVFTSGTLACIHADLLPDVLREIHRVTRRSVILLEYAREHIESTARKEQMEEAEWHGHLYRDALVNTGLQLVKAFSFQSFSSHPDRVPLSFFYAEKEAHGKS